MTAGPAAKRPFPQPRRGQLVLIGASLSVLALLLSGIVLGPRQLLDSLRL